MRGCVLVNVAASSPVVDEGKLKVCHVHAEEWQNVFMR